MSETLQRYAPHSVNDYGEDYCKCQPVLLPDPNGKAVLHVDAQRRIEELEAALEDCVRLYSIEDDGHTDEDFVRYRISQFIEHARKRLTGKQP